MQEFIYNGVGVECFDVSNYNTKTNRLIGIYKILSPSGRVYIGQSVNIIKRWATYKWNGMNTQRLLYNSFKKYGVDGHVFEFLEQCAIEQLDERERFFIKKYDSFNSKTGLNLQSGGNKNKVFSEETRLRISKSNKGKVLTDETKAKIKLARAKQVMPKGRKVTEEQKIKMIARLMKSRGNRKGSKFSEESRLKLSNSLKGKPSWNKGIKMRDASKRKLSESLRGRKMSKETIEKRQKTFIERHGKRIASKAFRNYWLGKKRPDIAEKLRAANTGKIKKRRAVLQFSKTMDFIQEFKDVFEAQNITGISTTCIYNCANRQFKSAGGYVFKYKAT